MLEPEAGVQRRTDDWIEVPGKTSTGLPWPLKLRPGPVEGTVVIDPTASGIEVDITKLRQGLRFVEEEHSR